MENDSISEVLSRLPAKSILRFETLSKGWRDHILDNSFRKLQCHRVKPSISGFFFQDFWNLPLPNKIKYVSINNDQAVVQDTVLDFLPEEVVVIASSNGFLCCHSCYNVKPPDENIYVCNPAKKEFVQIDWPKGSADHQYIALAFDPFRYPVDELSNFKLVCVCKEDSIRFLFQVYTSKTKEWRKLDVCNFGFEAYKYDCMLLDGQVVFAGGVLYWMTNGDVILGFDVETEQSCLIMLPVKRIHKNFGLCEVCIGESQGCLHFVLVSKAGIRVWLLDSELKWVLKHSMSLSAMEEEYPQFLYNDAKRAARLVPKALVIPTWIEPLVYKDEILLLKLRCSFILENRRLEEACTKIYSYNFDTRTMQELFNIDKLGYQLGFLRTLSYSMSLAPLGSA